MNPGIHEITNEAYHSSPGISKSGLDLIARSPYHFKHRSVEQTDAMRLGSAIHTAILEPDLFDEQYVVAPECDRRTKAGKAIYADFLEQAGGKEILKRDETLKIAEIAKNVFANKDALSILSMGDPLIERSVYWEETATGTLCKCRPDFWPFHNGIIADIKSTANAAPGPFASSIAKYRYHVQAAFYMDGCQLFSDVEITHFVFIAVETSPPYGVGVYPISDESIEKGRELYRADLDTYAACLADDHWPCYPVQTLSIPNWAFYQ